MNKLFYAAIGVLAFMCGGCATVFAGAAFDSLLSAASPAPVSFTGVFDGAAKRAPYCLPEAAFSYEKQPVFLSRSIQSHQTFFAPAVPKPFIVESVEIKSAASREEAQSSIDPKTEGHIINKGLDALKSFNTGPCKSLSDFYASEGVTIKWRTMVKGADKKDPIFALACPPEECGDKKVIYLNDVVVRRADEQGGDINYKDYFLKSNPTFLAITLAHELTHLSDYKKIGSGIKDPGAAALFLELNGWSTETYVYHQLLEAGIAPEPNSTTETKEIQETRLHLAIRDYVNGVSGATRPVARDYFQLVKSGFNFEKYLQETINLEKKGIMTLAGVVENRYGFPEAFESMDAPGLFASSAEKNNYKKYKKLQESLGLSTAEYIKWRKNNVDPVPPSTSSSSGVVAPAVPPGGQGHNSPSQPSSPSNGHDGEDGGGGSSGGGYQPAVPNPSFEPGTWPTGGQ